LKENNLHEENLQMMYTARAF